MIKTKYITLVLISMAIAGCGGASSDGTTSGIGSEYSSQDIADREHIIISKNLIKELCVKNSVEIERDVIVKEVPVDTTCATYEEINPSTSCLFADANEMYEENEIYDATTLDRLTSATRITCVKAYNYQ